MGVLINASETFQDRDLLEIKLALFQPKVNFRMELKNYIIQTAVTSRDIKALIDLRRHSFFSEFNSEPDKPWNEFDEYDLLADHIVLKHKKTGSLIGSYRILNSDFTHKFYSEVQFDMTELLKKPGHKIELSRACIHKDHRNGASLSLVWKGLAQYAKLTQTSLLFGCASVKSTSPRLAESMYWSLYPDHFHSGFNVGVRPHSQFPNFNSQEKLDLLPEEVVKDNIPPLLKVYLKAGAKLCSEPALDREMRCFDFLTALSMEGISAKYQEKYF